MPTIIFPFREYAFTIGPWLTCGNLEIDLSSNWWGNSLCWNGTDTGLSNEFFPSARLGFWNNQAEVPLMFSSNKILRCQMSLPNFIRWNYLSWFSHFDCWTKTHGQMILFQVGNEANEVKARNALHSASISFVLFI